MASEPSSYRRASGAPPPPTEAGAAGPALPASARAVRRCPTDAGPRPDAAVGDADEPRRTGAGSATGWPGRIVAGQRATGIRPVLEPLAALHRQSHPKADLALLQRAYDVAEARARRAEAQERRPVHHPPAGRRHHPGRPGHGHHHAGRRAAARHRRGHRRTTSRR